MSRAGRECESRPPVALCEFRSGHLIASLSSKLLRFLVNFQMKKAMIPIKARPPATDIPTIDPVLSPLESSSSLAALVLDWVGAVLVAELVLVTICVTSPVLVTVV